MEKERKKRADTYPFGKTEPALPSYFVARCHRIMEERKTKTTLRARFLRTLILRTLTRNP